MTAHVLTTRQAPLAADTSADLDTAVFRFPGVAATPETKITLHGSFVVAGYGDDVAAELAAVIAKHAI